MNVVLCCDGTGNKLDVATINVVRLFSIAKRDSPSEQVVYYHPGIGTMPARAALTLPSRGATRLAGNVAGYGLLDDVADLYASVMRALRDGDRIFIFGFSRGAFTIRRVDRSRIRTRGLADRAEAQGSRAQVLDVA